MRLSFKNNSQFRTKIEEPLIKIRDKICKAIFSSSKYSSHDVLNRIGATVDSIDEADTDYQIL